MNRNFSTIGLLSVGLLSVSHAQEDFTLAPSSAAQNSTSIPLYAAFSAGYLFDSSEEYYIAEIGYEFKNGFAIYAQANIFSIEESDGSFEADEDFQNYSLGLKYTRRGSSKWLWSLGGSVGVSDYELTISDSFNSFKDDDTVAYFDLYTRLEYAFTAKLSAHLAVRTIFLTDRETFDGLVEQDASSDTGIEAGLTYRF